MIEKYGFVYIWMDRKHNRYYIGSHWGYETDRYICSSSWMKSAYKRRPQDFKRRLLLIVHDRGQLLEEEHRWLSMIKPNELGKKYYNLTQHKSGHWTTSPDARTIAKKISDSHNADPDWGSWLIGKRQTPEHRKKHGESKKGRRMSPNTEFKAGQPSPRKGVFGTVKLSDDTKQKISDANKGKRLTLEAIQKLKNRLITDETREKLRKANLGKTHTDAAKDKMSVAHSGKILSQETKKKIGNASKGRKLSQEARKKISDAQKGVNNDPRSLDIEFDGKTYKSIRSAAAANNKSYHYMRKHGKRV